MILTGIDPSCRKNGCGWAELDTTRPNDFWDIGQYNITSVISKIILLSNSACIRKENYHFYVESTLGKGLWKQKKLKYSFFEVNKLLSLAQDVGMNQGAQKILIELIDYCGFRVTPIEPNSRITKIKYDYFMKLTKTKHKLKATDQDAIDAGMLIWGRIC